MASIKPINYARIIRLINRLNIIFSAPQVTISLISPRSTAIYFGKETEWIQANEANDLIGKPLSTLFLILLILLRLLRLRLLLLHCHSYIRIVESFLRNVDTVYGVKKQLKKSEPKRARPALAEIGNQSANQVISALMASTQNASAQAVSIQVTS